MHTPGYRDILKRHFADRIEENPRYSLRAFSRDLAISPSRLSEILNGKQGLSGDWAKKISASLAMNAEESEEFYQRVLASDARAKKIRLAAQAALEEKKGQGEYQPLSGDTFKIIADWYHFAILELVKVKGFQPDARWIGRRLGISASEAKLAVERLFRLNLLEKEGARWRLTNKAVTTSNGHTSEAIRKFNLQLLAKSREAVSLQAVSERDISSLTLAVREKDIPVVVDKIKKFRRELNAALEAEVPEGEAAEVYSLAIQFFRLSVKENT